MNSKKVISDFIKPNLIVPAIFTILPPFIFGLIVLLCSGLPNLKRANKCLSALESKGEIDKAAAELNSPNSKKFVKGKVILTENYIFCKNTGVVISYEDAVWAYRNRHTSTFFLIPISVNDSLCLASKYFKPIQAAIMGKDKHEEIKNAIVEIYNHNNACLVGYNAETNAKYKALSK